MTESPDTYRSALEAVERVLSREPEADEALRLTVAALGERVPRYGWVGLSFIEQDRLVLGPWKSRSPQQAMASELAVPVVYRDTKIGELGIRSELAAAFGEADRVFLERVALLISPYCLVGWDTGGVPWSDVA